MQQQGNQKGIDISDALLSNLFVQIFPIILGKDVFFFFFNKILLHCLSRSAYVEFMRKEAADNALSLDGTSFMSRILKVYCL